MRIFATVLGFIATYIVLGMFFHDSVIPLVAALVGAWIAWELGWPLAGARPRRSGPPASLSPTFRDLQGRIGVNLAETMQDSRRKTYEAQRVSDIVSAGLHQLSGEQREQFQRELMEAQNRRASLAELAGIAVKYGVRVS